MEKKLINIFRQSFGLKTNKQLDQLKKNTKIFEFESYDSFNYLKFISKIESNYNLKIDLTNISKFNTYKSSLKFLKSKKKNK